MHWAQTTEEGRRSSWEWWSARAANSAWTHLAPLVLVLLGFVVGLHELALLGIGVVAVIATLAWSWRKESRLKKQHEAEFRTWLKHQGTDDGAL